jgi:putative ABC transport system substrate-binding protein
MLSAPLVAEAQQAGKVWRIGLLTPSTPPASGYTPFRAALKEYGYVEGQNLVIEHRGSDNYDELHERAVELARLKLDVIVAVTPPVAIEAKRATQAIPIVFGFADIPVEAGLVASLSHPGGNVTGVSNLTVELIGKRLQLLKEVQPSVSNVALLWNSTHYLHPRLLEMAQDAASALRLTIRPVKVQGPGNLDDALARVAAQRVDALATLPDGMFTARRRTVIAFAKSNNLPLMSPENSWPVDGGLLSYGADSVDHFRRIAIYVHRILSGTKPADLPVEQPTTYKLVINLKTAKALGITIPHSLLLRADQVIE